MRERPYCLCTPRHFCASLAGPGASRTEIPVACHSGHLWAACMLDPEALLDDVCCDDPKRVAIALQAAHDRGNELVARIVARLESVLADPAAWTRDGALNPGFLLFLAAEFRATAAHAPIVGILRLEEELADRLLGDVITEGADAVLAETFPGDAAPLLGLVEDANAGPYARGAGLRALAMLWKRGTLLREDLLAWMVKFAVALDPNYEGDCMTANQLVDVAVQVHAVELRGTIMGLYERGLAHDGYVESA